MRTRPFVRTALLAVLGAVAAGCLSTEPSGTGRLPVALRLVAAGGTANATLAKRADITISGPGITPPITASFTFDTTGNAAGTLDVPIGFPRIILVSIFDANGILMVQGTDTITVQPGINAPAQLRLIPVTGSQPITVTVGSYSLTVAPGAATVAVGATTQFTAVVKDAAGVTVATPVKWATGNPAIATVDSLTGLVRGVLSGATSITATALGVAAAATVTVP